MKMQPSNPIELAVFNNLLGAIAEEMCAIVERTAYTTFVKETHDFGAGIATPDGVFFAYPRKSGVTSFLGLHVGDAIKYIKDWQPGDIVFTNDPFSTGALVTHLPDLNMLAPVFAGSELIGFAGASSIRRTSAAGSRAASRRRATRSTRRACASRRPRSTRPACSTPSSWRSSAPMCGSRTRSGAT
jgi:hypothetical protein